MEKPKKFLTNSSIFNFTIFSSIQYIVLSVVAMFFYPGSTHRNMDTQGYIFSQNFLSDLGRIEVYNGEENYIGAGIYFWILMLLAAATMLFFVTMTDFFKKKTWTKITSYIMAFVGVLAGMGLSGIAIVPANMFYNIHLFFVFAAFPLLLISLLLLVICIYGTASFPNKYAHISLVITLLLIGYVVLINNGPSPYDTDEGLAIQVTGQKIIVYSLVALVAFLAWSSKRLSVNSEQ